MNPLDMIDTAYAIKSINEDFQVTEVPLIPQVCEQNQATHTYLWLDKKNCNGFDIQNSLSAYFHLNVTDIGMAGLKDEDGITSQLISIATILQSEQIDQFNHKFAGQNGYARLRFFGFGQSAIIPRKLHGNSFKIVIRRLSPDLAQNIYNRFRQSQLFSFINYYDSQRFGLPQGPFVTHLIGQSIQQNNWLQAFNYFQSTNHLDSTLSSPSEAKEFFQKLNPRQIDFYLSAYTSYLWNQQASMLIDEEPHSTYPIKDVMTVNFPTDFHRTDPVTLSSPGFKFNPHEFAAIPKQKNRIFTITTNVFVRPPEPDMLNHGAKIINLDFYLPTGCYATMAIKQLIYSSVRSYSLSGLLEISSDFNLLCNQKSIQDQC